MKLNFVLIRMKLKVIFVFFVKRNGFSKLFITLSETLFFVETYCIFLSINNGTKDFRIATDRSHIPNNQLLQQ